MTAGKMQTDVYNVVHGTYVSPSNDLGLAAFKQWVLQQARPIIELGWTVQKFFEHGQGNVRSVTLRNYDVKLVAPDSTVHFEHYEITYQAVIVSDPVPVAIVLVVAKLAILALVVIAIAYTVVTLAGAFEKSPTAFAVVAVALAAVAGLVIWVSTKK